MGGSTKENTVATRTTQPWAPAAGALGGLLSRLGAISPDLTGIEQGALDRLAAHAQAGNPYSGAIGGVADTLLAGGPDRTGLAAAGYDAYRSALAPLARGDHLDPAANPLLQKYLTVARDDAAGDIRSRFAAAGRDLSGYETQALARGIAQAEAPILHDAYNRGAETQRSAIDKLYSASRETAGLLSNLDQAVTRNKLAGIAASESALRAQDWGPQQALAVEAQRRGIPLQTLATQIGLMLPAAQAFASTDSTSTQSTEVPLFDRLAGYAALAAALGGKLYK